MLTLTHSHTSVIEIEAENSRRGLCYRYILRNGYNGRPSASPHIPAFSFSSGSIPWRERKRYWESNLGSSPVSLPLLLYKRGKMSFLINKIRIQRFGHAELEPSVRLRLWGQDSVTSLHVLRAYLWPRRTIEGGRQALLLLCWSAGLSADWLGVLLACKLILCHTPQCSSNRSLSLD